MSRGWVFKSGLWNIICDRCSVQVKSDKIKQEWTGLLVCPDCFEMRHPQDLIKHRTEKIAVPFTRIEPPDTFVTVNYIETETGGSALYTYYVEFGYVTSDYFETGVA